MLSILNQFFPIQLGFYFYIRCTVRTLDILDTIVIVT